MWYKTSAATFRFSAYETLNKILRKPTIPFLIYIWYSFWRNISNNPSIRLLGHGEYNYTFCIAKIFEFYVYIQLHVQTAIKGNSH